MAQTTNQGGEITPFLEFVENYQTLDGKIEKLKDKTPDGSPVYYESMANIFANRDKRLAATVLYSGSEFKGKVTSIQAGQKVWNQQTGNYDYITGMSLGDKDENELLIRGFDGPSEDKNITNTGFYLKKFVSTSSDAGLSAVKASNYWPIFRYAEILLNTAEAGFELGKPQAIDYINAIREDAGFGPNSLVSLTFEDIIQERKVELAFEGHRYFDLKRWRLSEKIINGVKYHGLYPYLIVHPGNENHLKYTFERVDLKRLSRYKSEVYGNLVYNGQVVPVKNGQIPLNFYQDSYKGNGNFQVMPSQDGKINALLFDGEYKIILASNQGAYEENATPYILNVKGKTELNWEITPFFFVNKATYNCANKQITAKVDISKISQNRDLEFVSIIVSKSIICDRINKEKEFILNASDISNLSDIHITGDLSNWKNDYFFVRIGVKSVGNTFYNYSQVQRIEL